MKRIIFQVIVLIILTAACLISGMFYAKTNYDNGRYIIDLED